MIPGAGGTGIDPFSSVFPDGGEAARLCRETNWAVTPLGPVEEWPQSLRTAVSLVLGSGFPMILVWGPELIQIYNEAYIPLIGRKHPAALAMPTHACWPEIRHLQEPIFERVFQGETVNLAEAHYPLARNGTIEDTYFDATFVPVLLETGEIGGSVSTLFETTAQVRARDMEQERQSMVEALRASEERFRKALEIETVGIIFFDSAGNITGANEAFLRMGGYTQEDITAGRLRLDTLTPPEWKPALARATEQLAMTGSTAPYEKEFNRKDGSRRWGLFAAKRLSENEGVEFVLDITERTQAEETLRATEARLRLALEAAQLGDWELDLRTRQASQRSFRHDQIFGYREPVADWSYERFLQHVHSEDRHHVDRRFRVALERGESWDVECRIYRVDGELRWIWARGTIQADAEGQPMRALGIVADITERKRAEAERERLLQETEAARVEAEAANRAKSEFLAVMSHELRTPLNAIGGYAELIDMGIRGPVTETQRADLARIQSSQRHLLGLINEVLNYAKLETGSVRYDITIVPVRNALTEAEALVAPQVRAKGLTLRIGKCPPDLTVHADAEKFRQILVNLLSNAVKFTDSGMIELRCEAEDRRVAVHVHDTGIGIPEEKLQAVFEPFVQVRADLTRTAEGTGLGLAISRDLARGMSGDLTVESVPGEGSTFTLHLPRAGEEQDRIP